MNPVHKLAGCESLGPDTPAFTAAQSANSAADLRRLRRAPGRGSLGLNFEACVCMRVSVWFVCLCVYVLVCL